MACSVEDRMKSRIVRGGESLYRNALRIRATIPRVVGILITVGITLSPASVCRSQNAGPVDGGNVGYPINGVFSGGSIDSVQLNNGNLHVEIPLLKLSGIGIPINVNFVYDTKLWNYNVDPNTSDFFVTLDRNPGAVTYPGAVKADYDDTVITEECEGQGGSQEYSEDYLNDMVFVDEDGTAHRFPANGFEATPPPCDNNMAGTHFYALDSSGIHADRTPYYYTFDDVTMKDGTKYTFPIYGEVDIEDANGNKLKAVTSGGGDTFTTTVTDTANRTVTLSGHYQAPTSIQYTDQNGNTQTISIAYSSVAPNTQSLCGGHVLGDNCFSVSAFYLPNSITLQDGSQYTFQYYTSGLGDLKSITLPTGATISYTYGDQDQSGDRVLTRTVVSNGQTSEWQYQYGSQTTVTDPNLNDTQYTCTEYSPHPFGIPSSLLPPPCYMTQERAFNGSVSSGNVIVTKTTGYTITGAIMPTSTTVTWAASGQTAETDTTWDVIPRSGFYSGPDNPANDVSWGNPLSKLEYDYGSGSHGALLRNTQYSYLHEQNSAYVAPNIADRPTQVAVYDSSSTLVSETTTNYDQFNQTSINGQSGLIGTSGTTNHDYSNFGSSYTLRGLPTSVTKYVGQSLPSITTYTDYNDLGNATVSTDGRGNSTTYQYGTENAFLSSITYPSTSGVAHVTNESYDLNTGLLNWKKDWNLSKTSYSWDSRMRPTSISYPDGGSITYSYPHSNEIDTTVLQSPNPSVQRVQVLDGLGREQETTETTGISGRLSYTYTTYDLLGRKYQVYNPTFCNPPTSNCGESTWGYSTYSYDPVSRLATEQNPDSTSQTWTYSGTTTTFKDENQNQWQRTSDALNRLTQVVEPGTLTTTYGYDPLGNLLSVSQAGNSSGDVARSRTFTYDSLSRLVCASNPESATSTCPTTPGSYVTGTVGYSYDENGNLHSKTDARGVTTNYLYDALNRLYSKTYTNGPAGSLSSCYQYDTATNGVGQLAAEWTQAGSCASSPPSNAQSLRTFGAYDAMGRVLTEQQCAAGYCTSPSLPSQPSSNCIGLSGASGLQYCYDLAGNLLAFSNGVTTQAAGSYPQHAILFSQAFDEAGSLNAVASSWSDLTHPQDLFYSPVYTPFNTPSRWLMGGQLATRRQYDSRLRVTCQSSFLVNQTSSSLCQ